MFFLTVWLLHIHFHFLLFTFNLVLLVIFLSMGSWTCMEPYVVMTKFCNTSTSTSDCPGVRVWKGYVTWRYRDLEVYRNMLIGQLSERYLANFGWQGPRCFPMARESVSFTILSFFSSNTIHTPLSPFLFCFSFSLHFESFSLILVSLSFRRQKGTWPC